jgi:membrane-associated phospholipid phosphatase
LLRSLDLVLLRLLRTRGHAPPVEAAIAQLSRAGEHGMVWHALALLGALLDRRRRPVYLRAVRAVLAAYLLNTLVKAVIRRARPVLEELPAIVPTLSGRSYPSAHSSMSFAAAHVLSEALPRTPVYALAGAMALSRPYLGVHYPSDVVAGVALGEATARLVP